MTTPRLDLNTIVTSLGDFTEDAILITEAEQISLPGPKIVWCNAAFTRMTGYTLEDVLGKTPRILQGPDTDKAKLAELGRALRKWQTSKVELKNYKKDGTPFWVEFAVRPVMDENGWYQFWVSVQRETTDRVDRERLLRKTTQILERAPFGLALLDRAELVSYANPAFETLLFGDHVPPDAELPYTDWIQHALSLGRICETPDAPAAWLQSHLGKIFSGRYTAEHTIGGRRFEFQRLPMSDSTALLLLYDVEDRHILQEQVQRAGRLEAMGQITGGVAHDFNNLLAVILGNLELLRIPDIADERDGFIQDAIDATLRGRALTTSLLGFARKSQLQPSQLDLIEVTQSTHKMIARVLPPTVRITMDLPAQVPDILADRTLLENAVLNLAINARDAMDGTGQITLSVHDGRAAMAAAPRAQAVSQPAKAAPLQEYVEIAVQDTGPGIPESIRDRVIEPFFTTKDVGQGSGMGLSLVHGFVEQSGGDMVIESAPGQGTRIALRFPSVSTPRVLAKPPTESQSDIGLHLLFVEDDPAVRKVVGTLLRDLGCSFETAPDGAAAMGCLAGAHPFDALLTDLAMPDGPQGDAVARAFRIQFPDRPVLMLCGNPDDMRDVALLSDPLFQVLLKPVQRSELRQGLLNAASLKNVGAAQ